MSKQATETRLVRTQLLNISRVLGVSVHIQATATHDTKTSSIYYRVYTIEWSGGKCIEEPVAEFYLGEMPGCPAVCISFGSVVYTKFRNKGAGKLLNKLRESIARIDGFSTMFCTVDMDNDFQIRILDANGWASIGSFLNKETGHNVNLRMKTLE